MCCALECVDCRVKGAANVLKYVYNDDPRGTLLTHKDKTYAEKSVHK